MYLLAFAWWRHHDVISTAKHQRIAKCHWTLGVARLLNFAESQEIAGLLRVAGSLIIAELQRIAGSLSVAGLLSRADSRRIAGLLIVTGQAMSILLAIC
jgi:hypothetical protein